ncbi:MAG: Nucleoside hydrolase [Ilumatobacteraceae bacterium]|nr:Nucleoside hydrolase [Ilumatobacteraceae bacterium]
MSSASDGLSLVIDTDTASDDAIALLIAVRTPGVTVEAVTVVAGNVPLSLAVRNAIVTLDLVGGAHVPVHAGLAAPLLRPLETAQYVHGEDGMGGATLPEPSRAADDEHAVDVIRRIARDEPGRHTLVTLGPLSNIAAALLIEPDLLTRFRHTYLMAGAFDGVGNVHPLGEFNGWADPEAASIVVDAPGAKTFIGWDISRRYSVMTPDDQARLAALGPLGQFSVDINAKVNEYVAEHGLAGFDLPDPIAMAVAIDPTIMTKSQDALISIGTDPVSRGGTIVDHRFERGAPNARIAVVVDEARFKAMLFAACAD